MVGPQAEPGRDVSKEWIVRCREVEFARAGFNLVRCLIENGMEEQAAIVAEKAAEALI
jgi:hypothetical protein